MPNYRSATVAELKKLWKDPLFKGAFTGARSFQSHLKYDKNIKVSFNKILSALKELPNWVGALKRRRKFKRRQYKAGGANTVAEIDIGIMKDIDPEYIGFLVLVDIFTSFIYALPLKSRKKEEIKTALSKVLKDSRTFEQIVGDAEFDKATYYRFFTKKDIHLRTKAVQQHVNFAEIKIATIKRRLFSAMRTKKTHNWSKFLVNIVKGINATPTQHIGKQ